MSHEVPQHDNQFTVLEHDVPQGVVDYVFENLHDEKTAIDYTQEPWDEFTENKPNLRSYISQAAYEIAPDDLELRQRITQRLLGLYSVIREARVVEVLEEEYSHELETPEDELIESITILETSESDELAPSRKRLFRRGNREKHPKVRGVHRSIAATVLLFGLSGRSKANSED